MNIEHQLQQFLEREGYRGAVLSFGTTEKSIDLIYGESAPQNEEMSSLFTEDTLFDMASVSKLFTTTLALHFFDKEMIDLEDKVAQYLPNFERIDITLWNLLTHTGVLEGWLGKIRTEVSGEAEFVQRILSMGKLKDREYLYQCPNAIVLGWVLEEVGGESLDSLIRTYITQPLGMKRTGYGPKVGNVAPSEIDPLREVIQGVVHDPNAYLLGGVAGNAGIFSSLSDMKKFISMWINGGVYNGVRILKEETVKMALSQQYLNGEPLYQGLGWKHKKESVDREEIHPNAFTHGGHTGTFVVIVPDWEFWLVLLTNHKMYEGFQDRRVRRSLVMRGLVEMCLEEGYIQTE